MNRSLKINFAKDNLSVIANITQALDIGDIKTAHRLVHTLKSTAGQIGEKSLRAAAAKVEAEISKGKSVPSKERIGVLESELNSVLDKLAPLLAEAEARSIDKTTDAEKVREIIEKLEPMLKNKNPECEDLLDDIRSIPNSEELVSHIEMFNFKKATEEFLKIKEVWTKE
jgi:HPt (histidine-containing phosphotransfer) domain-containing protein